MDSVSAWEAIFMLVVLKVPMIYLAGVVWWAIRAEPGSHDEGSDHGGAFVPLSPCGWDDWKRTRAQRQPARRRPGPRGGPPARRTRVGAHA